MMISVCYCDPLPPEENNFFCNRHNCIKTAHFRELCLHHDGYWQLWEEGRGPGQRGPGVPFHRPNPSAYQAPVAADWSVLRKRLDSLRLSWGDRSKATMELQEARIACCLKCEHARVAPSQQDKGVQCLQIFGCSKSRPGRYQSLLIASESQCPGHRWIDIRVGNTD